jgi:AraC family transcriptional regulator of arabinose operon
VGLLLPGKTESFTFARDRPTRHSWIALAPQMIDGATRQALDSALCCLPLSAELTTCVDLAYQVDVVDTPSERPVLTALAGAALALYLAQAQHQHRAHVSKHAAVVGHAREIARRRATQGIGVDDLAREVGVSPEHLVRLFRRHAGVTPGALLREERLAHALHLLTHTGLTVADVARQSGFASPHHFARVVRAATGMTATQLRARSWATEPAEAPSY